MAGPNVTKGKDFENAPVGTHMARCIKLIDLGTQHGSFEGRETVNDQFIAVFELPNTKMSDGQPFTVTRFYNKVFGKKSTLRKDLESWRGAAFTEEELKLFNLKNLLGKPCMVSVIAKKDPNDGVKVGAVFAVPHGTAIPPQINPSFDFWITEWNQAKFDSLSDGLKELIQKSDEYKAMVAGGSVQAPAAAAAGGSGAPF